MENHFCNNCGKTGHVFSQCKMPITSIGIIVFRYNGDKLEYLMIRRKETLGFIDFMRGKYSLQNKKYIVNMMKYMTVQEKKNLMNEEFDVLWKNIWCDETSSSQYKSEETYSREKFYSLKDGIYVKDEFMNMNSLVEESNENEEFQEPEWGFPKGRRNTYEKDYDCAIREFCEESGFEKTKIYNIQNIMPVYEIFTGSNYKSYKHKYFVMYMKYEDTLDMNNFQRSEVSKMEWFTLEECIQHIRPYNLEKMKIITNIDVSLKQSNICIL